MRSRFIAILLVAFGLGALACEDDGIGLEAYPSETKLPMFGALRVHQDRRQDNTNTPDGWMGTLELIVSDRPLTCSNVLAGDELGTNVVHILLYNWRPGPHRWSMAVTASGRSPGRARWALDKTGDALEATGEVWKIQGQEPVVTQLAAPTVQGERARFVIPEVHVATLPAVDPSSCCALPATGGLNPVCEDCPLPTRIERIGGGELDAELCDDVDPNVIRY